MLDFDKATKILTEHFANLTPEQFELNLREYCPELFPETIDEINRSPLMKDTDIYQQAQQDSKLQIAPKLLNKGLSIQEVAELLELDIHNVEETAVAHGIQV